MQLQACHFCGYSVALIHVHGHYQCPVCHINALPCCDGDNCDTNQLLMGTGTNSNIDSHPEQSIPPHVT
jgi:hypothetical protein